MAFRTEDYDYPLDESLIARHPAERRDASRLMVLRRPEGRAAHHRFADLPNLLAPGDVLVLNDTRVVPAKFHCRRATGGRIEGLFLREPAPGRWEVLLKSAGRCDEGESLRMEGAEDVTLTLRRRGEGGQWSVEAAPPRPAGETLDKAGAMPLPPYIGKRGEEDQLADRRRYQTVYARRDGAVAAPTAGLHFTPELLDRLAARGVRTACVTLHVGLGTFAPVKAEDLREHPMHAEWFELPAEAADTLQAARAEGRRIVAVGTTSVRVLETAAARGGLRPCSGWTDIFLYPPAEFRAVDALITNFHLPRSTLVMLVAAFCDPGGLSGRESLLRAYAEAQRRGYRFFSYGDAMLIL